MHDLDFGHRHESTSATTPAVAPHAYLRHDAIELLTIGVDVGSATSHLMFSELVLNMPAHGLSSRYAVADKKVTWRSPIVLTPFKPDGTIDTEELRKFFRDCYEAAGLNPVDVDSGAIILTGDAMKGRNVRLVEDLLSGEACQYVCASAGHQLECVLAAHGSGATALSRKRNACGLHVDIGGGTTKLALINEGRIVSVCAFAVGGRVIARDARGVWKHVCEPAKLAAKELGLRTSSEQLFKPATRNEIAKRLASVVVDRITNSPLDNLGRALQLTEPLDWPAEPKYITFSGGVSEYIVGHEARDFGDIGMMLASEIAAQLRRRTSLLIEDAGERIRATAIGASQQSAQVSGRTVHLEQRDVLPLRNVPVVHLRAPLPEHLDEDAIAQAFRENAARQGRSLDARVALAFTWSGAPEFSRLLALAKAIQKSAAPRGERKEPLVVVTDGDIGKSLGHILQQELQVRGPLISIDGIELNDLDFVNIGEPINPSGALPVIIKSLLFA